jgi:hypothetical protein
MLILKSHKSRFKQTSHQPHTHPILLLNNHKAVGAQASFVEFAYVLHLVEAELHGTALALGERIGLTFKRGLAAFATDDLVFGMHCCERK